MSWSTPPGAYGAADPLFLLLIALAVDAYVGDLPLRLPGAGSPRRAVAGVALDLERRLNRPERSARNRRLRGALVAALLALAALGLGALVELVTRHYPFAWVIELFLLVMLVDQRGTWRRAAAVSEALRAGSAVRAREALRRLALEPLEAGKLDALEAEALGAATLAALGRRFAGLVVGPVLWYALFGLPGLFLQQSTRAAALALGPRAGPFGRAPRALECAVSFVPDYLAGLLLGAGAAFIPGARPWPAMGRTAGGRIGPAGALGAAFATAPPGGRLRGALGAFAVACLIDAGLVAALALARLAL